MTDEELERQAKLWHVESQLADEKVQAISTQLKAALPSVHTRRRWKLVGSVMTLISLPLGGVAFLVLTPNPLARESKIERLQPYPGDNELYAVALAPDGTVGGWSVKVSKADEEGNQHPLIWKPGSVKPEALPGWGWVNNFRADGAALGAVLSPKGEQVAAVWQKGKCTMLFPLPGYQNSEAHAATAEGIVGESQEGDKHQATLWRNGKPEPLETGGAPDSRVDDANQRGDILLRFYKDKTPKAEYAVLRGKTLTPLKPLVPNQLFVPWRVGADGTVVGMAQDQQPVGVRWFPPEGKPERLLPARYAYGMESSNCNDIDERGRLVGMMTPPLPAALSGPVAYLWEKGQVTNLNTLLPAFSGWHLFSASRIQGRVVLGQGTYQKKNSYYRLTLPRKFE